MKTDRIKPLIDLLVEQHQIGAPDGVIRLTGRCIQGETLREVVETCQPVFAAMKEVRACFGVTGTSIYLMRTGVDMERAIKAYDAAVAAYAALCPKEMA